MNKKHAYIPFAWVELCWAIVGSLLLLMGYHAYHQPDTALPDIANHLGYAMLFTGCANLLVYHFNKEEMHGVHWLLADGLCAALLSVFPIFNQMLVPMVIPFFFGIWELFSGILKFIESSELHEEKVRGWHWFFVIGMVELVSGGASLLKPIDDYVGMSHVVAIIFFVQGFGYLFKMIMYSQLVEIGRKKWHK